MVAGGRSSVRKAEQTERLEEKRRFKPYPAYKDSGVEWLGKIPAGWELKRLKHLAALNVEALPEETDPAREMVYVDIGGVDSLGRIIQKENLTFASAPTRARRLVRDGDIIVSTVRTYLRAIAPIRNPEPGLVVSTGFAVVRPDDGLTAGYAAYALRAPYFVERVVGNSKGVSFPAINESEMATYDMTIPPAPEQRAIAAFLDRQTVRIDALVAKNERLIGLLQEQRTALITRAGTKGLDPTVPMKDSGVEWLGEIPAHWEVKKLAWLTQCLDGSRVPLNSEERGTMQGDYPYWGATSIVDHVDRWLFDEELVLLGEDGAPFFDRTKSVAFRVSGKIWVNNHAHVLRPQRDISAAFLAQALNCVDYRAFIDGTTRDKLTQGDMDSISVQCPPLPEQRAIAAFLDRETARIDALISKVRNAIELLKELRTALISAAVTGRIDVREEVS